MEVGMKAKVAVSEISSVLLHCSSLRFTTTQMILSREDLNMATEPMINIIHFHFNVGGTCTLQLRELLPSTNHNSKAATMAFSGSAAVDSNFKSSAIRSAQRLYSGCITRCMALTKAPPSLDHQ